MNLIFTVVVGASIIAITIISPDLVLPTMLDGVSKGVSFCVKLFCVYFVWTSVLKIWEKLGFTPFIAKKSKFLLKKLFPNEKDEVYNDLSINLSANFLGMGSASTPAGISASKNITSPKNRTMLLVINSCSIQLIPTTIIALRSSHLAQTDIILPSVISTFFSVFIGILLVKIFVKK